MMPLTYETGPAVCECGKTFYDKSPMNSAWMQLEAHRVKECNAWKRVYMHGWCHQPPRYFPYETGHFYSSLTGVCPEHEPVHTCQEPWCYCSNCHVQYDWRDGSCPRCYPWITCICCGKHEQAEYTNCEKMVRYSLCFECLHWIEIVADAKTNERRVFIYGESYLARPRSDGPVSYLGFGGAEFFIERFNGELLSTNDLWYQGGVPDRFRLILPDNARFLTKAQFEEALEAQAHDPAAWAALPGADQ